MFVREGVSLSRVVSQKKVLAYVQTVRIYGVSNWTVAIVLISLSKSGPCTWVLKVSALPFK